MWDTGGGGSSQSWFHETYTTRILCSQRRFSSAYAWEASKHDPATALGKIPAVVKPRYHWLNVPIVPEVGHPDNPLTVILSETTPSDFVVFKLDVDDWRVEEAVINQILDDKNVSSRIDELFWEHHVSFEPMASSYWGAATHTQFKQEDSLRMFDALRRRGIKAHSWV